MSDHPPTARIALRSWLALAGLIGLSACAAAWMFWPEVVLRGYLIAHQFWLGVALGSLVLLMIHHLAGGWWSASLRRTLEAASLTLPLLGLLFVPVLLDLDGLYVWARPEAVEASHPLQQKHVYLNRPFFAGRAVVYFLVWTGLAWRLRTWSRRQDQQDLARVHSRLARLSGPGLVLYALTVTFASTDWVMSLQPQWFSTIFCMVYAMLQLTSALSWGVAMLVLLRQRESLQSVLAPQRFAMMGNLLLAATMLWAYVAFSQWMLTWTANLPDEIAWYLPRRQGGWQWIGVGSIGLQFGVPFLVLLSSDVRRQPRRLAAVAWLLLLMCLVNWFWQVAPSSEPTSLAGHWPDMVAAAAATIGIGATWGVVFAGRLAAVPLLPKHDPALQEPPR